MTMNLYKVTLNYGYEYQKAFSFLIVASDIESAKEIAEKTFKSYDYGSYNFHSIELLASEGQYAKPNILLLAEKKYTMKVLKDTILKDMIIGNDNKKNWVEDFEHENGMYENICLECKGHFIGDKHRKLCKECAVGTKDVIG